MSDEQDHMDYEVNNHVEVSVTPFPCKGRLPKKKIRKKCGLLPNQGGGVSKGSKNQTSILEKYFFS